MQLNRNAVEYFVLRFRVSFSDHYAIWCSNDHGQDYVLASNGIIPYFSSRKGVEEFAKENQLRLKEEESIRHNLDAVRFWLHNQHEKIDCNEFLAAWNLLGDVAAAFPEEGSWFEQKTQDYIREYDKLFYGNNLKAMRGRHPKYYPVWSVRELEHIKEIMGLGLHLLKRRLRKYA